MRKAIVKGWVAVLWLLAAVEFVCAQAVPPAVESTPRQPVGELRYSEFAHLNPGFTWMRDRPQLTFKISAVDLGGCPEFMVPVRDAVHWALAAEARPGFSGFDSAEVYCRAEADGRRFVGVAFVVTAEWIPMFTCRVGPLGFSGVVEPLGRISGPTGTGAHGFEVLVHGGTVTHVVFVGESTIPEGEPFALVQGVALRPEGKERCDSGPFPAPLRLVQEDDGTYLYALDRRLQRAKGTVEVTGLRFGGTETVTLFYEELPCKTESCASPEDLAPAVKRLDTYLQGKKLLPIRME